MPGSTSSCSNPTGAGSCGALLQQVVPANVRHGQAGRRIKHGGAPRHKAKALHAAVLLAALKQQLQAQADTQKRPPRLPCCICVNVNKSQRCHNAPKGVRQAPGPPRRHSLRCIEQQL